MAPLRRQPVRVALPPFGVSVFESAHAPDFHAPPMRHPFWKLLLALRGEGRIDTDAAAWPCRPGQLVIVPAGTHHQLRDAPGKALTLLAVCLRQRVLAESPGERLPHGPLPLDPLGRERVRSLIRQMLFEQSVRETGYELALVGLAKQLVTVLLRQSALRPRDASASERTVRAYIAQLHRRFFETTDIDAAARQTGLSRRRFTELFRQQTGDSHCRYVQRLRIEHAKRLLRDTDRSIAAIAFECGFGELSSFYRAFARHEHRKPSSMRRENARRASP